MPLNTGELNVNTETERLWKASDVAKYIPCSVSWVYKAVERGELPCIRLGALLRFDPAAVRRLFQNATTQPGA